MKTETAIKAALGLAIVAAVGYAVYLVKKNGGVLGAGAAVGAAVADAGAGVVLGIGDSIGLQRTDMTECQRAIAEGRTWDASFACPAGTFLKSLVTPTPEASPSFNDRRFSGGADTVYDLGNPVTDNSAGINFNYF